AATFVEDPDAGRWGGPVANNPDGCVRQADSRDSNLRHTPSHGDATLLRDAAFVALVEPNRRYALAVRDELLAQARVPGVDFTNRNRYCLGTIDGEEKPMFTIANWQTRLLYAYDYVRIAYPELFSTADAAMLDRWFAGSAEWMQEAADSKLDELFGDRTRGNYQLTEVATGEWSRPLYFEGEEARTLQRRYNNRVAATMRFVALVGVDQSNQSFIDSGRRFATEFIRFAYYPTGTFGEFERWTDERPILGWKYAVLAVGSVVTIADVMARAGDPSVYAHRTTDGALGTEGTHHTGVPKSLATMVADLMRYVDQTYERYGTNDGSRAGDARYLINSIDDLYDDRSVHDTMLAMSNRYYRDPFVRNVYQRTAPGTPGYPANPTHGQGDPEGGEWGTYPGALFMFGGLEDAPSPYRG
ncbi:MAG TPA: hypothetical protein VMM13_03860, partial [Euzebya sp.]|nr:hypothetical protein [Euzebya sp.]